MRNLARIVLVACALAVLPTASADAIQCQQPFTLACQTLCDVSQALDRPCLK